MLLISGIFSSIRITDLNAAMRGYLLLSGRHTARHLHDYGDSRRYQEKVYPGLVIPEGKRQSWSILCRRWLVCGRTEIRGRMSEGKGRRSEVGCRRTEGKGRRSEVGPARHRELRCSGESGGGQETEAGNRQGPHQFRYALSSSNSMWGGNTRANSRR